MNTLITPLGCNLILSYLEKCQSNLMLGEAIQCLKFLARVPWQQYMTGRAEHNAMAESQLGIEANTGKHENKAVVGAVV